MKTILYALFIFGVIITAIGLGNRGKYARTGEFSPIITIIGVIIITPFLIYLLYQKITKSKKSNKLKQKEETAYKDYISSAQKSILNLNNVKFISINNKNPEYYNTISSSLTKESNNVNTIVIRFNYKSEEIKYSFETIKSFQNIKIHFAIKKETYLYDNDNNIYVDFSFLE